MDEAQINKAVRDLEDTRECEHDNESNFEDCEEEISEIYKLAQKNIGSSFIITALQAYLNTDGGNDVVTGGRFVCSPRQRDANPCAWIMAMTLSSVCTFMPSMTHTSWIFCYILQNRQKSKLSLSLV